MEGACGKHSPPSLWRPLFDNRIIRGISEAAFVPFPTLFPPFRTSSYRTKRHNHRPVKELADEGCSGGVRIKKSRAAAQHFGLEAAEGGGAVGVHPVFDLG